MYVQFAHLIGFRITTVVTRGHYQHLQHIIIRTIAGVVENHVRI